jgi:SOS-response transcriptional repressor LexA
MAKRAELNDQLPSELLRVIINRITALMEERKTSALRLSKDAGLGDTAISDILKGKNNNPSAYVIKQISHALRVPVSFLVGETSAPAPGPTQADFVSIPIIGDSEAGAFRQMTDFTHSFDSSLPSIKAHKSKRHSSARHFALRVRGDSMNAARPTPIVDGVTVLCVDVIDAGLEIEGGRIYALRRTRDAGQTYECTIKRAVAYRDRYEFLPESTGTYEKYVLPRNGGADDDVTEVQVIGLVYAVFQSLE